MNGEAGGGSQPLALVIPLFGGSSPARRAAWRRDDTLPPDLAWPLPPVASPAEGEAQRSEDRPVPAASRAAGESKRDESPRWNNTWLDDPDDDEADLSDGDDGYDACGEIEREIAEKNLLRKLRTRSLSIREARAVVAERDLDGASVEAVIDGFIRNGYLDDARLAEQLVHTGVERKGQGRRVVAQTLAQRGIPRDVADAALEELPDDDGERALEFARTKARAMRGLDHATALRRLSGQLARRGYAGPVALNAARTALGEGETRGSGVRFDG